jgi:uncharacterized membrane protein
MLSPAKVLRQKGASDLDGRWNEAALLTFVYSIICGIFGATVSAGAELLVPHVGTFFSLLLLPMGWGFTITFLSNHRREDSDPFGVGHLFDGYRDFVRIFLTLLLEGIYIVLWALLLIIPGIIKALSYSMTSFILRDRPDLKYNGAIELSMAMMQGHKWELFWLYLTFIGWAILCIFTFCIGFFWLEPYVTSTMANFYEEVKEEYEGRVFEKPAEVTENVYNKSER